MSFNHAAFQTTVARIRSRQLEGELALSWLERAYETVTQQADQVIAYLQDSDYGQEFPQEVEFGLTGMQHYLDALQLAANYLELDDAGLLDQALSLAAQADACLRAAFEMNQNNADDMVLEMVA